MSRNEPTDRGRAERGAEPLAAVDTRLRQLEKALATMQVGVTITDTDRRILFVNRAEAAMHGYEVEELVGRDAAIFAPESLRGEPMGAERLRGIQSWRRESVNLRKDGTTFPVEILSDVVTGDGGEPIGVVSISADITERKRAEAALRESEQRYALAVNGANDGLWDWNLSSDRLYFSPRWWLMLGEEKHDEDVDPDAWWSRVHFEDLADLKEALANHLEGRSAYFQSEHRMLHADGTYRWMLARGLAVRDGDGRPSRIAGSQTDITDRKVHDPLTGLPNRALFLDRLGTALRRGRRRMGTTCAVLFLDLDRFKVVNDSLGHLTGDHLLVGVAKGLEACLRPGDTVARLGGDEFTILLEDISSVEDASQVAERVHAQLESPFTINGQDIFTTASIGIAVSVTGRESAEELLRDADTAMYRAKSQGSGRHQLFDQDMRQHAVAQLRIETDIRHAIDREEFVLHYQPIVSLSSEKVTGFEALIRWQHPDRGLIGPFEFIPIAEETGLIVTIGHWVLNAACRQLREWQTGFGSGDGLTVSVNLSPKQFNHPRLVQQVEQALLASELTPRCLELEITESAFIDNAEAAIAMIESLRAMGVQVSIDDFGTGYSSLSYLHRFPVDTLKIDQSFVSKMDKDGKQVELVSTIIKMATNLGIQVVAEGVETGAQRRHLKRLSCDFMQGFAFSKPVPAEEIGRRYLAGDRV